MKKIFLLFLFLPMLMLGCQDSNQLAKPENINFDGALTWDEVENAEQYVIRINDEGFVSEYNYYDSMVNEGVYEIEIYATAEGYDDSSVATYSFEIDYDQDATITFDLNQDILSWSEVIEATHYFMLVTDDSLVFRLDENSFDISDLNASSVMIQAVFPDGSKTDTFNYDLN